MKFDSRVAIVTGGAGSIGRTICSSLAREGAKVVVGDVVNEQLGAQVVSQIEEQGGRGSYWKVDISNSDSVNQMIEATLEKYGKVDFLVNCAGIATDSFVVDMAEEDWDRVIAINLKGTFLCSRAVLPCMIGQRFGRIVNIASLVSRMGSYKHAHYAASKAGVLAFTMSLAKEVGQYGITVNSISPGRIRSTMEADRQRKEQSEWIAQTPMGRMGEPHDIANTVMFLCSDDANFVTGETINVNGGLWMG